VKGYPDGCECAGHLFHYMAGALEALARLYGFDLVDAWSRTPESWFRLNLKAALYPKEHQLDWFQNWLDVFPIRYVLMCVLRVIELPCREKDCLVVQFRKQ